MNKVSWTSKDDLYRATTVVLATVVLMAVFLFVVDWLWLFILRNIGVLQFTGGGASARPPDRNRFVPAHQVPRAITAIGTGLSPRFTS